MKNKLTKFILILLSCFILIPLAYFGVTHGSSYGLELGLFCVGLCIYFNVCITRMKMNNTDKLLRAFIEASGYTIEESPIVLKSVIDGSIVMKGIDYKVTKNATEVFLVLEPSGCIKIKRQCDDIDYLSPVTKFKISINESSGIDVYRVSKMDEWEIINEKA